jgi:hypothetical protein
MAFTFICPTAPGSTIAILLKPTSVLKKMIVLQGKEKTVKLSEWNGRRVWIAGMNTPWSVVQTYASGLVIMVTDEVDYLQWDMSGIHVITNNPRVTAEVVFRGGYCMECGVAEGLWRLRALK